jgi:hypothetical protein
VIATTPSAKVPDRSFRGRTISPKPMTWRNGSISRPRSSSTQRRGVRKLSVRPYMTAGDRTRCSAMRRSVEICAFPDDAERRERPLTVACGQKHVRQWRDGMAWLVGHSQRPRCAFGRQG